MGKQNPGGNDKQNSDAEVNCHESIDRSVSKSLEVWCICRIVKPCTCEKRKEGERNVTPTPGDSEKYQEKEDSNSSTPTPGDSDKGKLKCENGEKSGNSDGLNDTVEINLETNDKEIKIYEDTIVKVSDVEKTDNVKYDLGHSEPFEEKAKQEIIDDFDDCVSKLRTLANSDFELRVLDINTGNSFQKDLIKSVDVNKDKENGDQKESVNTEEDCRKEGKSVDKVLESGSEAEMDQSKLDSISISSFDHLDASFCSLKSTDTTMEQGDLADQLSLVQQMVMEMKQGFSTAMEELSKIQYGDQNLQQQLADNKTECAAEVKLVTGAVEELKVQVQTLTGQIERVTDAQRTLQEKIDSYQTDKEILLEELEKYGLITDQLRLRLSGIEVPENNNNNLPDVAPMVHPYLNSIQNHSSHRGPEEPYNDDASLTAAVHRSLSLTQALGEKCQNLDASTVSSEDDVNSRHSHSHSGSGHKPSVKRHGSFNYEDGSRSGQKIPPHEQVLEEVHREEAAHDIVDAERDYCTQIWSLVDSFMNPLREEEIVSLRECNILFPAYIPLIYEQHCIMLRKLEERMRKWKFSGVIGDTFAKLTDSQDGDGLLLYKAYINDFPAIINCMNKWFAQSPQFCDVMQCPCLANSPVLPLLLAPLQQVPKYSLLLKNLLKYTPSDHPDRYYLESSLHKLKTFLNTMNDDLEHAMNVLNINSSGVSRSRETGASVRSRSSGSSGEVNHMSSTRDSGVHSGEERPRSPLSPNTTRRFVLQVLRERREKGGSHSPVKTDHHQSTPRGHNHSYGSHPDLTYNMQGYPEGRTSPYLATLPQSKTFTALSKLPLPHERGKKVRVNQKHEVHRPGINTNYLRPLTPQLFPTSTSAHSFDSMRRREELAERARMRPASAIEMSTEGSERLERYHDMLRYQAASPTRQSVSTGSSDRSPSRKDMQISLHKLLAETGHSVDDDIETEQERERNEDTYHKQFLATKDRILRKGSGKYQRVSHDSLDRTHRRSSHGHIRGRSVDTGEDYGIYGEDDDVDNDISRDEIDHENVKPMKLLSQSHRPKIMVPKWRQNAPLQPPGYNASVEIIQKQKGYSSEENLAASLVQSLMDNPVSDNAENRNTLPRKNLKRKEATGRRSPRNVQSVPLSVHTPNTEIENDSSNDVQANVGFRTEDESVVSETKDIKQKGERKERRGSSASTALIDVITYTADCLERSDSNKVIVDNAGDKTATDGIDSNEIRINGEIENSHSSVEETQVTQSLPSGQDSSDHANSETSVTSSTNSEHETRIGQSLPVTNSVKMPVSHSASSWANLSKAQVQENSSQSVNTDNLVYYFQNRKNSKSPTEEQEDANETNEKMADSDGTAPSFYNKTVTSTPTAEGKTFAFNPDTYNARNNIGKKDRLVRADDTAPVKPKEGMNGILDSRQSVNDFMEGNKPDSDDKSDDSFNKEKVLRAVDRLRMSFERPKTLAITNQNQTKGCYRPASADSTPQKPPLILKTFTLAQKGTPKENKTGDQTVQSAGKFEIPDSDNAHRMYRKAGGLKSPTKHFGEATATARQIQKLERSASPTVKQNHPVPSSMTDVNNDRAKSPFTNFMQNAGGKLKRGTSPQRASKEASFIPQRSGSPVRAVGRPLSASSAEAAIDPLFMQSAQNGETSQAPLKSSMKDTKIPVLRKSGSPPGTNQLSKSTEDISKMKKKSAFKDSLKNIFGRKKKKLRSSENEADLDSFFADMQLSFQQVDDMFTFPVMRQRSHSTSQILQSYRFEEDDDDPVSAV